jgi:hypothetical protein
LLHPKVRRRSEGNGRGREEFFDASLYIARRISAEHNGSFSHDFTERAPKPHVRAIAVNADADPLKLFEARLGRAIEAAQAALENP